MKFTSLVTVFLISIFLIHTNFSNASDSPSGYKIGDKVEDFTVTNYDGATYTLSNSGGKATVLMFWSTQCPFARAYNDRAIDIVNQFGQKGIAFWGINSNKTEPTDVVMNHATEHKFNFPMLKDNDNVIADKFSAERTPEVFVIDNSNMTLIYHGRIDDNKEQDKVTSHDLANALSDFLSGNQINVSETKAFGCTIKR